MTDIKIYDEILIDLKKIFISLFNIDLCVMPKSMYDKHLLGIRWQLYPRDLLCLYFQIQKEFNICIPKTYIVNGEFSNVNNIVQIISEQLYSNSKKEA